MEDAQLLERLTLLRALYLEARQQSKRAFPLSALSLLSLHDAVEGFLHLTALHLDIALPSGERFMAYWDTFAKRGIDIPQKGRMQQLNDDRVRFKHRGRLPHASEIPLLLDAAASLFEQVCEEHLSTDFNQVTLAWLVHEEAVKAELDTASEHMKAEDHDEAISHVARAFRLLEMWFWGEWESALGGRMTARWDERIAMSGIGRDIYATGDAERLAAALQEVLRDIESEFRLMSVGIDLPRLKQFLANTPDVTMVYDGDATLIVDRRPGWKTPTRGVVEYCHSFVIETAMHMQRLLEGNPRDP